MNEPRITDFFIITSDMVDKEDQDDEVVAHDVAKI